MFIYPNLPKVTLEFQVFICNGIILCRVRLNIVAGDGCPTNDGESGGMKAYSRYSNPHNVKETCTSHSLALGKCVYSCADFLGFTIYGHKERHEHHLKELHF